MLQVGPAKTLACLQSDTARVLSHIIEYVTIYSSLQG